ncbi:unnamed protein product [Urochloa humidicola]
MSQLVPSAAAAAAAEAEDEEEETMASPGWGGGHGDGDAPRPHRSCEGRQSSDFLATRMRKSRHLRAAAMEDEEAMASLGGRHDAPYVLPHPGSEGSQRSIPRDICRGELQGEVN